MKTTCLIRTLVLACLSLAASVNAQIIYNNLGASSGGSEDINNSAPFDSFTSAGTAQTITGLEFALYGYNLPGTTTAALFSDSGTAPGALIATLGTLNDATISTGIHDYTVSLTSHPLLAPNTRYWIGLTDPADNDRWSFINSAIGTGVAGEYYAQQGKTYPNSDGPWQVELEATNSATTGTVPDVGSTAFSLGLVFAALVVLRGRPLRS